MKLRTSQLVCLALLLTTLTYAGSPALGQTELRAQLQMQVQYLRVLGDYGRILATAIHQSPGSAQRGLSRTITPRPIRRFTLEPAAKAAAQIPWTIARHRRNTLRYRQLQPPVGLSPSFCAVRGEA